MRRRAQRLGLPGRQAEDARALRSSTGRKRVRPRVRRGPRGARRPQVLTLQRRQRSRRPKQPAQRRERPAQQARRPGRPARHPRPRRRPPGARALRPGPAGGRDATDVLVRSPVIRQAQQPVLGRSLGLSKGRPHQQPVQPVLRQAQQPVLGRSLSLSKGRPPPRHAQQPGRPPPRHPRAMRAHRQLAAARAAHRSHTWPRC